MNTNNVPRLPGNLTVMCARGEATINGTMESALLPTSSNDELERPPLRCLAEGHLVKLDSFGREKFLCPCAERTPVPSEDAAPREDFPPVNSHTLNRYLTDKQLSYVGLAIVRDYL